MKKETVQTVAMILGVIGWALAMVLTIFHLVEGQVIIKMYGNYKIDTSGLTIGAIAVMIMLVLMLIFLTVIIMEH